MYFLFVYICRLVSPVMRLAYLFFFVGRSVGSYSVPIFHLIHLMFLFIIFYLMFLSMCLFLFVCMRACLHAKCLFLIAFYAVRFTCFFFSRSYVCLMYLCVILYVCCSFACTTTLAMRCLTIASDFNKCRLICCHCKFSCCILCRFGIDECVHARHSPTPMDFRTHDW